MFSTQFIRHKEASQVLIDRVIALKQSAWPYPKDSQLTWIKNNLKDDDFHVILHYNNIDIAYLNLCKVNCIINGFEVTCFGIGNVCAKEKNKGYGKKLVETINDWLTNKDKIGLLFCHPEVESFYCKCGWSKIETSNCSIAGISQDALLYTFNIKDTVTSFCYNDRLF